jgi:uncharacterized protein
MASFPTSQGINDAGQGLSQATARFMSHVYAWMTFGVILTAVVSYELGQRPDLVVQIMNNPVGLWGVILLQLGAVMFLSFAINRISSATATVIYLAYAALTGVTFATIFLAYTQDSIASVFGVSAVAFGGLSLVGYTTKRDLGPVGTFCTMALWGLLAFYVIGLFVPSLNRDGIQQIAALVGLVIFSGLTAYDTQKIKAMGHLGAQDSEAQNKGAIMGALRLYLDFINLFLMTLRLFGRRR